MIAQENCPLTVRRNFGRLAQNIGNRKAVFLCHGHVHTRHQREVECHVALIAVIAFCITEVQLRVFRPLIGFGQQHAVRVVGVDFGTDPLE